MKQLSVIILLFASVSAYSQSTFNRVYSIFQSKCVSCHGGATPAASLDLSGSESQVYNAIVEVNPTNSTALAKGDKLIDKGYPERSFLLRKVAHGLSDDLLLASGEGIDEPNGQTKLDDHEIEIIRQWIIYGAPQSGTSVNYQRLVDYYNPAIGGIAKITRPPPPPPGQGMQIHLGPVFWGATDELEYFKKYDPRFNQDIEVYKYELYMNSESHHFILRKFGPGEAQNESDGLQPFNTDAFGRDFVNAWQISTDLELPAGTGFFYDQTTVFDLNFHMKNYHTNEILPGEVYLNVWTRPRGTATVEMKAELIPNTTIYFLPNETRSFESQVTRSGQTWNIWMLSSHTHKFGIDYDIFLGNSTNPADKIYEGFYDFDYTFNQGFYEWSHPPVKRFSPMLPVNMTSGIKHKATYNNTSSSFVTWSFQTTGEMMLIYVQYTTQSVNYKPPVTASNTVVCNSADLVTDGGLREYHWSTGDITQTITVYQSGSYDVTVVDGSGGTYTSDPLWVDVLPGPVVYLGSDTSVCGGDMVTLDAGSGYSSYLWSTGDVTQTISVTSGDTYTVEVSDNGCVATDAVTVSVSEVTTGSVNGNVNVLPGETTQYTVNDNAGSTYSWVVTNGTVNSGQGSATVDINWTSMGTGTITVIETNDQACVGAPITMDVNVGATGITTIRDNELSIFPNPATNAFKIEFSNPDNKTLSLRMIDITGKTVKEIPSITGEEVIINRGNLSEGIYFIELRGERIMRGKIVIAD